MGKQKIDIVRLSRLLQDGKSPKECSQIFGVSQSAICQARQKTKSAVVKDVALRSAHKIVTQQLDTVGQLSFINTKTFELLDLLKAFIDNDPIAVDKMIKASSLPKTINTDPKLLFLKTIAEIRSQLQLQLDIYRNLYDMKGVQDFQELVLDAINEVSPEIRKKIVQKLQERRAIGSALRRP